MINTIWDIGSHRSDGVESGFPGPDANGLFDVGYEDLAVADASGLGGAADRIDGPLNQFVGNNDLDLNLGQEVDDVFCAPVKLGMALLPPEPLGFGNGNALQSNFLKRFFDLVELEWLDDGFDFLHGLPPGRFQFQDFRLAFTQRKAAQVIDGWPGARARTSKNLPVQHNDPEPASSKAGSMPSCKRRSILERYQAFNRHPLGGIPEAAPYSSLRNRQIGQSVCSYLSSDLRTKQEMPQEQAILSWDLAWKS
jgi:hypothetical protein